MTDKARISRKSFIGGAAALGVGGALLAAGCGGDDDSEAAAEAPAEETGGKQAAPGGEPFLIGSPYATTGPYAADGIEMTNGTQLAIDEINGRGGIHGRPIERIVVDTVWDTPEGVTTSFQKLVDEEVDAIVGGYVQVDAPTYDIVPPYGAPYVHGNTIESGVARVREDPETYHMFFNVDPTEVWYGRGLPHFLNFLRDNGLWTPSDPATHVIEGDLGYSQTISGAAQETLAETGEEVVGVAKVITPTAEWGPVIGELHGTNPGFVFNTHPVPGDLAAFSQQFAANPTDSLIYLQYGPSIPQFLELAGESANGIVWSTVVGLLSDDLGQQFRQNYETAFGVPSGFSNAPQGYDSIYMLARAWAMVGDQRDFRAVSDQLLTMRHRGVAGSYYMNNPGQFSLPYPSGTLDPSLGMPHVFFQIQNGEHKIIYPPPYVEADFQPAPWMSG